MDRSRRHEVMKAVLLNSADKLNGVHGSDRDIRNKAGQLWDDTPAYNSATMPLDLTIGAGHLNVTSAITNFAPGEHDWGVVPNIGWDFSSIAEGNSDYEFETAVPVGGWIAATLAWDRIVTSNEVSNTTYTSTTEFFNDAIETQLVDLNLSLIDSNGDVAYSSSALNDSVEHIFWQVPAGSDGLFTLRVTNAGNGNEWPEGYGLAWWAGQAPAPKPGDFNGDGTVNGADLQEWKNGFGEEYDGNDFLVWQRNYEGTPATAVPEPSGLLLVAIGLMIGCRARDSGSTLRSGWQTNLRRSRTM